MKRRLFTRVLSALLTIVLCLGNIVPTIAVAAEPKGKLTFEQVENSGISMETQLEEVEDMEEKPAYADTDVVSVSIILQKKSTLEAGYSTQGIGDNASAMAYRDGLKTEQTAVTARIERAMGAKLDVVWNLTLAANIISANVQYGQMEDIKAVSGVKDVVLETLYEPCEVDKEEAYEPNMSTSPEQIGSPAAYAAGYTGAGTRIAVIDTGLDLDHISFSPAGFQYSLALQAGRADMGVEEYIQQLDLLDAQEIQAHLDQLNVKEYAAGITADSLYQNMKVPFGYNYIDRSNTYLGHDQDLKGEHGSHVAGIATSNAYVPNGDGTFSTALNSVLVQGVAPDAQLFVMKVFGQNGGAYDSDYMAAIEDAIVLGADSVNLSLGSTSPGFTRSEAYQEVMDRLTQSDAVVVISAGNAGHWADNGFHGMKGYLYAEDVDMFTGGSPGTYANALTVASVDNAGVTGGYISVDGKTIFYNETSYNNLPLSSLAGEHEYVFLDSYGSGFDFAVLGSVVAGKIAICSRGTNSFSSKAVAAVAHGAIATIVYNNEPGVINMDLSDYQYTAPCVSITQEDGALIRAASTSASSIAGVRYYTGTITIGAGATSGVSDLEYYTMSDFSAWGVPGDLSLKPEITAPGGNIYSVNGLHMTAGGMQGGNDQYEKMSGTSMAAPQVAGMSALVSQYIRENKLDEKTGLSVRALTQSLLMSTAEALLEDQGDGEGYYSVLKQGAGLGNVGKAVAAGSYVLMHANATDSYADGKVKVELGDDPDRTGQYTFGFTLHNLTDVEQKYSLYADLFTQGWFEKDGYAYMDTQTDVLHGDISWTVDGEVLLPETDMEQMDFNGDGLVTGEDAQALLDYITGIRGEITNADAADLDGNGSVTSYDAYLFLRGLNSGVLTLPAGGKTEVQVTVTLTQAQKEALEERFVNGAYVEGFVFAQQLPTAEGVEGTVHSIPVLGFYGNWSDPSMFDKGTYIDRLYGNDVPTYFPKGTAQTNTSNSVTLKYAGDRTAYRYAVNPYCVEETYPEGRRAISSSTTIYEQGQGLIRNSAALAIVIDNQDKECMYMSPVRKTTKGFSSAGSSAWYDIGFGLIINKKVSTLGVQEGDEITISCVAVPELYETEGNISAEQLRRLMDSGVLGSGVCLSTTMKVDDTAPQVLNVYKDLNTGNLVVETRDNNYVASVQVKSTRGKLYASAIPEQTEARQRTYTTLDLSGITVGSECYVVVGDYAKNETAYLVQYAGEKEDFTGQMYGYTWGSTRGEGKRWMEIDPETVWYGGASAYGGTENLDQTDLTVTAAEYANGYVFMAADDGYLYVAPHNAWSKTKHVSYYANTTAEILDMAYNYADQTLYALGANSTIYSVDQISGKLQRVAVVSVTCPNMADPRGLKLTGMAIDDNGTFYAINHNSGECYLYKFTLDQVVGGAFITGLAPINNTDGGSTGFFGWFGCLAWDHDKDILYMTSGVTPNNNTTSYLVQLDPETGKGTKVNTTYVDNETYDPATCGSLLNDVVFGLYIVPSTTGSITASTEAMGVALEQTEVQCLRGTTFTLTHWCYPWNLTDTAVTWTSSDETVATVAGGVVTTVGVGTATITATTVAKPNFSATCEVTVENLPNTKVSALIYNGDGDAYWSEFETDNLAAWNPVSEKANAYIAGTFNDRMLYTHDGSHLYGVDADTFAVTDYGQIDARWQWSDAAAAPADEGQFGFPIGICNGGVYLEMLVEPEKGSVSYFDSSRIFGEDPMATIAFAGSAVSDHNCYYYILTEAGKLWYATLRDLSDEYRVSYEELGSVGLNLAGVSAVTGGMYASMTYDPSTGYLLLSRCLQGETSELIAIDPETLLWTKLGDFGQGVRPVVSLYQYERITELTVFLNQAEAQVWEEDSVTLTAQVLPSSYQDQVTWSTSDASVATVDEHGVVTAIKGGTATVTATSVDVNDEGEHATASCTVTVKSLGDLSATVNAQVVTENGAKWVTIDAASRTFTVNGDAVSTFPGAGAHEGKLYGAYDADSIGWETMCNVYEIDPDKNYEESVIGRCPGFYIPIDVTPAPKTTVTLTDDNGEQVTKEAFGMPFYTSGVQFISFVDSNWGIKNYGYGWSLSNYESIGAIAYIGDSTFKYNGEIHPSKVFYILGYHGTLYRFHMWAYYNAAKAGGVDYLMSLPTTVGNIGEQFPNRLNMTMTYIKDEMNEGLIVGNTSENGAELYYIDLTGDAPNCVKIGRISGASAISGLYTDADLNQTSSVPEYSEDDGILASSEIPFSQGRTEPLTATELPETAPQAAGGLNALTKADPSAAQPASSGEVSDGEDAVVMTVTAKDATGQDVASTNGLITVSYDASAMTLKRVAVHADYTSVVESDGAVTFAYAGAEPIAAGKAIATLEFQANSTGDTEVTIQHQQVCDWTPDYGETVPINFAHPNTELRDAKEATCTEDGYSGDVYCTDCGLLLQKGEGIPAKGHTEKTEGAFEATCTEAGFTGNTICATCGLLIRAGEVIQPKGHTLELQNAKEPTCTEAGYTGDHFCTSCNKVIVKGDVLDALGHDWSEWEQSKAPSCTEAGEETCVCARCQLKQTRAIEVLPCPSQNFEDLDSTAWYHESVDFVLDRGLMIGMSDTVFSPNSTLTRAQFICILYRMAGSPEPETAGLPFLDVPASTWYTKAVAWAYQNSIALGTSKTTFTPNAGISREQMVVFLFRYAQFCDLDTTCEGTLEAFHDAGKVSAYAKDAMVWAVQYGIILGDQGNLNPMGTSRRVEAAAVAMRYLVNIVK